MIDDSRTERMRRLNADPDFAERRDEYQRERFTSDNAHLQALANIAKRGCDVPARLENEWRALKRVRVPSREAAIMLGIPWLGYPDDETESRWAAERASQIAGEIIDTVDARDGVEPDLAYELIELARRLQRVLRWNSDEGRGV